MNLILKIYEVYNYVLLRLQVEDEDTLTGARVVEGDEDDDDQGIENILGRSKLRAAADGNFWHSPC